MERIHITCIGCPLGCDITIARDAKEIRSITGHTCKRGERYARNEVLNPTRTVTTTVWVEGGNTPVVPVKTKTDIPKEKIFACVKALKAVVVKAPVQTGDILVPNIVETGVDIVATKSVGCKNR